MTGEQRDELVEARADFILAYAHTANAYVEHFEAQMLAGKFKVRMDRGQARKLLSLLGVLRRCGR